MITLKRKGFFTASFIILLICLAVSTAALSLVRDQNLTINCISWYDRQFLTGKEQLKAIQTKLFVDPRFPDFVTFIDYMARYPKESFQVNNVTLSYLGSVVAPTKEIRYRFSLTSTVNGSSFVRPVLAVESSTGKLEFQLAGIAF